MGQTGGVHPSETMWTMWGRTMWGQDKNVVTDGTFPISRGEFGHKATLSG